MKLNLPKDVSFLLGKLRDSGFESYIVGGCVRDSLLGRTPKDWDITTSAQPSEIKTLFSHTVDTGIAHGTVTVVRNHVNYEITTYRIDGGYHDCRHPNEVQFTTNLEEDLLRRDFTMNAIAYHPDEGFKDPYGGQRDIQKEIIRGVGESAKRFQEDALRMLRALRFAAQLGFSIEGSTYSSLIENKVLIRKVSAERIREELDKLLLSPYLDKVPLLWESGILGEISETVTASLKSNELVSHLKQSPNDKIIRYALFLQYCTTKEGEKFLRQLKPDNQTFKEVSALLANRDIASGNNAFEIKQLAAKLGIERFFRLLNFQKAAGKNPFADQSREILLQAIANQECITMEQLAVSGNNILALGIPKGPTVGATLAKLLEHVHQHPEDNTFDALKSYII